MGASLPLSPPYLPQTPRPTQWKPEQYPQSDAWIDALYSLMSGKAPVVYGPQQVEAAGGQYGYYKGPNPAYEVPGDTVYLGSQKGLPPIPQNEIVLHELSHRLAAQADTRRRTATPEASAANVPLRRIEQNYYDIPFETRKNMYSGPEERFAQATAEAITSLATGPGYNPPDHFLKRRSDNADFATMMSFLRTQPAFANLISQQSRQLPDMTRVVR